MWKLQKGLPKDNHLFKPCVVSKAARGRSRPTAAGAHAGTDLGQSEGLTFPDWLPFAVSAAVSTSDLPQINDRQRDDWDEEKNLK